MSRWLGRRLVLSIDGDVTLCAVNYDLQVITSEVEVNNENNGTWADFDPDLDEWSLIADYFYEVGTENMHAIYAKRRTEMSFLMKRDDDSGFFFSGTGFIRNFNHGAPLQGVATWNFQVRGKGELVSDQLFGLWIDESQDFFVDENDDFILI